MTIYKVRAALFGMSVAGLAVLSLVYGNFAPALEPFSKSIDWPKAWTYGLGTILLAASAGLFFARIARPSAIIIGLYGSIWALSRARPILLKPLDVGAWYGLAEAMGPLIGLWLLYAMLPRRGAAVPTPLVVGGRALRWARMIFGAGCIVYGAAHFAYASYTASMVPAWLPGRVTIVYLTGTFHAAAGIGLLVGFSPRLAATLEATMLSLFGLLVWLPTFFAHNHPQWASTPQVQWSETFLSFLLAGSAWLVAASLQYTPHGFVLQDPVDAEILVR